MATKPPFPPDRKTGKASDDSSSEDFDANEFRRTRLSAKFFRWAISTPLPQEREENLWRDTEPPIKLGARRPPKPLGRNLSWLPLSLVALLIGGGLLLQFAGVNSDAAPAPPVGPSAAAIEDVKRVIPQQKISTASDDVHNEGTRSFPSTLPVPSSTERPGDAPRNRVPVQAGAPRPLRGGAIPHTGTSPSSEPSTSEQPHGATTNEPPEKAPTRFEPNR